MPVISDMTFNPATGLRDPVAYTSKPSSGTGSGSAREQVQGRMDELKDYINNTLVTQLNSKIYRIYMEV